MSGAAMTYREAIIAAQREELLADRRVVLLGEDIGAAGGSFKLTEGLQAQFGTSRVRDTPISEQAFVGAAMGMALTGYRPIVELMFADFMGVCFDQIINSIAKHRFMQGGTLELPLVIRAVGGAGARFGAQHSQTGESWLLSAPGLKVFAAAAPNEAYHLIRAAVRDPNPVVVLEHKLLFTRRGPVQLFDGAVPPVEGPKQLRPGTDITIVASLAMVERSSLPLRNCKRPASLPSCSTCGSSGPCARPRSSRASREPIACSSSRRITASGAGAAT
jgi:pyruvate dehydrogenase E1 component beta subunit